MCPKAIYPLLIQTALVTEFAIHSHKHSMELCLEFAPLFPRVSASSRGIHPDIVQGDSVLAIPGLIRCSPVRYGGCFSWDSVGREFRALMSLSKNQNSHSLASIISKLINRGWLSWQTSHSDYASLTDTICKVSEEGIRLYSRQN